MKDVFKGVLLIAILSHELEAVVPLVLQYWL